MTERMLRMETELRTVLALPAVRQRFAELDAQPAENGAQALAAFTAAETDKWAQVVREAKVQAQ